jgi:hypothetical protein
LEIAPKTRWSPGLEESCLILSAQGSYAQAAQDLEKLTGIKVSSSTQQRLVQRRNWSAPQVEDPITEMSLDGGMVRLRTPLGEACEWREYKAVSLHGQGAAAFFKDQQSLLRWLNAQPLAPLVACLGDGHDGVWNLFAQVGEPHQRLEILDWYHLSQNAQPVRGSPAQLTALLDWLWHGQALQARSYLFTHRLWGATAFVGYLQRHQHRIINYAARQDAGASIGSGSVESLVKQIAARVKRSGAQWSRHNVPKVLLHRCAYLNGELY